MKKKTTTKQVLPMQSNSTPNPRNPQYQLGLEAGRKSTEKAILEDSPYHQLLHSKDRINQLGLVKSQLEKQLEQTKKELQVEEERLRGLKNQVEERIK